MTRNHQDQLFSVAIATFNGGNFLAQQLDSIVLQSYPPFEVIISDDGSEDNTLDVIRECVRGSHLSYKLIRNSQDSPRGILRNFETAITECSGEYICICDQDDYWLPCKIQALHEFFTNNSEVLLVVHDGLLCDSRLIPCGLTKMQQLRLGYGSKSALSTGCLTAFNSRLRELILPFPENSLTYDHWIHYCASILSVESQLLKPLQLIRRHFSNSSSWVVNSPKPLNRVVVILKIFMSLSSSQDYRDRLRANQLLSSRLLLSSFACTSWLTDDRLSKAKVFLARERVALLMRSVIRRSKSLKSFYLVFRMLFTGNYQYFGGFLSFLSDLYWLCSKDSSTADSSI